MISEMDAEDLREKYNTYFRQSDNRWTSTDKKKTQKVVKQTLQWLKSAGFRRQTNRLLDVGCATGHYTESFRLAGFEATGLDYSDVVIEKAKALFPTCNFVQMDGFNPNFDQKFDLIFCRGFSGCNTHDLDFIAGWVNKYMQLLTDGGFFVLAYSSDFSGKEAEGETVNLSRTELDSLSNKINGTSRGSHLFQYFGFISRVKKEFERVLLRKKVKEYFYLLIQKHHR